MCVRLVISANCTKTSRKEEKRSASSPLLLCVCEKFAPCLSETAALPGKHRGKVACTHLGDSLLVPHDSLLDECVDLNVPVPARNHHPGLPEAHRHFHGSVS
ncbi:hypothetical protein AMECASPLE_014325 [Ameca splendens]|uniref:Uncharacterized protein n=1 Tax=Ameca splendens TaxID=208324 RepID=A0ABV0ZAS8_9TELE